MFKSEQFIAAWDEWKQHYMETSNKPYTSVAERKALSALWQKCCGMEQLAIDSINYSMEKNWSAIYIKTNQNGQQSANGSNTASNSGKGGTSNDRVERASNW
jgi:hypothetical protein